MKDSPQRDLGSLRFAGLAAAAGQLLLAGAAWAGPPTVESPATVSAGMAYRACLLADLGQTGAAAARAAAEAVVACGKAEAELSAAVLKENPDRPLFARSYAQTLKDAAVAQAQPSMARRSAPVLVAQTIQP